MSDLKYNCCSDLPDFHVTECCPEIVRSWENGAVNAHFNAALQECFRSGGNKKILKLLNKQYKITSIELAGMGCYFNAEGKYFESDASVPLGQRFKFKIEYMHPDVTYFKPISHGRSIAIHKKFIYCF